MNVAGLEEINANKAISDQHTVSGSLRAVVHLKVGKGRYGTRLNFLNFSATIGT